MRAKEEIDLLKFLNDHKFNEAEDVLIVPTSFSGSLEDLKSSNIKIIRVDCLNFAVIRS